MSEKKTGVSPRTDVLDRKLAGKQRQEYSKSKCKDSFVSKATFPKSREDKSTRSITEEKTLQDVAYLRMGRKGHEHLLPAKLVIRTPELSDVFAGRKQEEPEVVSDEIHSKDKEDRKTSRVGKYRRPIAAGLTLATGLGLGIAANVEADVPSGSFQDVSVSNPYYTAIETMASTINPNTGEKIIDGYPERVFKPENDVTRQQFAKMIVNTLGLKVSEANVSKFKDVTSSGPSSLYPDNYVAKAEEEGIIKGYEGNLFKPYNNITRAQAVTMVIRSIQAFAPDILKTMPEGTHSQYGTFDNGTHYINMDIAEVSGLLKGMDTWENNKDPYAKMTRGEVAQILFNALIKLDSIPETTTTTTEQQKELVNIETYSPSSISPDILNQLKEGLMADEEVVSINYYTLNDPVNSKKNIEFYMVNTNTVERYLARDIGKELNGRQLWIYTTMQGAYGETPYKTFFSIGYEGEDGRYDRMLRFEIGREYSQSESDTSFATYQKRVVELMNSTIMKDEESIAPDNHTRLSSLIKNLLKSSKSVDIYDKEQNILFNYNKTSNSKEINDLVNSF